MGYNAFLRKIANRLVEAQGKNADVNICLESIPDWKEYVEGDLKRVNDNESKPLGSDPRKKGEQPIEDDLEYFFQTKGAKLKMASSQDDQDDDDNEKDHDEDLDFEQSQNKVEYEENHQEDGQDNHDLEKYYRNVDVEKHDYNVDHYYSNEWDDGNHNEGYGSGKPITLDELEMPKKEEMEVMDQFHQY